MKMKIWLHTLIYLWMYYKKNNPSSIIIRSSWLYSSFSNNFLKKMINAIQDSDEIKVVDDQFGSYTCTCNLANSILFLIKNKKQHSGIYNYTNSGNFSWYQDSKDLLEKIISKKKLELTFLEKFLKELNSVFQKLTKTQTVYINELKDPNDRRFLIYKTTQEVLKKPSFGGFLFKR